MCFRTSIHVIGVFRFVNSVLQEVGITLAALCAAAPGGRRPGGFWAGFWCGFNGGFLKQFLCQFLMQKHTHHREGGCVVALTKHGHTAVMDGRGCVLTRLALPGGWGACTHDSNMRALYLSS